jgi:hypothetical protein
LAQGRGGLPHAPRQVNRRGPAPIGVAVAEQQHGGEGGRSVAPTSAYPTTAPLALCIHAQLGGLLARGRGGRPHAPRQASRRGPAPIGVAVAELQHPSCLVRLRRRRVH